MDIPLSPTFILAKQQTEEFYRSLGTEDAKAGKPPRPLSGIDPCWVKLYNQSYQQTLDQPQQGDDENQEIPF